MFLNSPRNKWINSVSIILLSIALLSIVFNVMLIALKQNGFHIYESENILSFYEDNLYFEGFNNETGVDRFIVPNIIHLIRFNKSEFNFSEFLCLQAAFRYHRPDWFYIHTDVPNGQFTGKYWKVIENDLELRSRIKILRLELPYEIFGQPLSTKWRVHHGGDVARIRTMMKYGGIYLDNDVFVIQNLDKYRKFEIAMNWDEDQFLGSQVIIAHKNARFLSQWLDSYHEYHPELWYFNAGEKPTKEILMQRPEVVWQYFKCVLVY